MPTLEVRHNSTNITDYIVDYRRELDICTGIGIVNIEVVKTYSGTFEPWDNIDVYEDGVKRGEFNVGKIETASESHNKKVFCQDNSKKLADYFIAESYYTGETYYTTRYWIEKFMNDANVNYTFTTTSVGAPISKHTTMGIESAYEVILRLLQQSGWYMYFNDQGNAVIGRFSLEVGDYRKVFNQDDILSIHKNQDDKMLRNRAVVWGNAQIETGEWVFADIRQHTTWNYDEQDLRTILFSNSDIYSTAVATDLANQMLQEFCRITETKTVKVHGFHNVHIGDVVLIRSQYHNGAGLITSLEVTANGSGGFITTLILDERCPRLFSYYGYDQGKVYCGTNGNGVWEKDINGSTWSDFSTGIIDLSIKDLAVANGIFASVTNILGTPYVRDVGDLSWTAITYGDFVDETDGSITPAASVRAVACAINRATSAVYFLFSGENKAWVGLVNNKVLIGTQQVYLSVEGTLYTELTPIDVDTDDSNVFVTVGATNVIPYFSNYQFPVVEAFTHYDLEEFKTYSAERWGPASNCFWELGKVHWASIYVNKVTRVVDPFQIRFITHNFITEETEESAWLIPPSGYGFPYNPMYLYVSGNTFYVTGDVASGDGEVFTWQKGAAEVIIDPTYPTYPNESWQGFYNGIFFRTTTTTGLEELIYNLRWYDIRNPSAGVTETPFASVELRNTMYTGTAAEAQIFTRFNTIGILRWFIGKNTNDPLDNNVNGCCSYDANYFEYAHILGCFFNTETKEMSAFNEEIHPKNILEATDANCTSHAMTGSTDEREVIARWSTLKYSEGIPWVWGQLMVRDSGPWIDTGVFPPYELQGFRDGDLDEDGVYQRTFRFDPVNLAFYPLDKDDYRIEYYGSLAETDGINLSSQDRGAYWNRQRDSGIGVAGITWRDKDYNLSTNTYLIALWTQLRNGSENQQLTDFYTNEWPVAERVIHRNAAGNPTGYDSVLQTYPPLPIPERPTTSGYTHRFILENLNGYSPTVTRAFIQEQRASQNVFALKYQRAYSVVTGTPYWEYGWSFYQFGDWENFFANFYATTVNTPSGFQIIDLTQLPHSLEVGASGPIVTYAKAISGYSIQPNLIPSGILRVGYTISGMSFPSGYLLGSPFPSGYVPNYTFVTPEGDYTTIYDARPFRFNSAVQMPLESGYMSPGGNGVLAIAMDNAITARMLDDLVTPSGWHIVVTYSGHIATNLETTNFFNPPYMFTATVSSYNTSGQTVTFSGVSNFYQRYPAGPTWYQYNLPVSSYITCIRTDDLL